MNRLLTVKEIEKIYLQGDFYHHYQDFGAEVAKAQTAKILKAVGEWLKIQSPKFTERYTSSDTVEIILLYSELEALLRGEMLEEVKDDQD